MRCTKGFVGALVLVAGLILVAAPEAGAADKGKAKKNAKQVKQAQDNVLVHELRQVYRVVEKADPIYKGHRVKAMHEIKAAIGQLEKEMHRRGLKPHQHKHGINEPKSVSDAEIALGMKQLSGVLSQLNGLPATNHRTKAANHIGTAIKQLKRALAVAKQTK
jgi:hypothetical protein